MFTGIIEALGVVTNLKQEQENLIQLTSSGRLPISANNIRVIPLDNGKSKLDLINENSDDADLTLIGFNEGMIKSQKNNELFEGYDNIGNILFVDTIS